MCVDAETLARAGRGRTPRARIAGSPRPAPAPPNRLLIIDGAYEGNETVPLARQLGYTPIVPPNPNRLFRWEYDRLAYRRRNEIEPLFRRLKGYHRLLCRYDKLDFLFMGFIVLALIVETSRFSVNRS